jgi:hypothetical protein
VRRRRIQFKKKAERVGEIDIREFPEHGLRVQTPVEKTRENGTLQQRSPPAGVELEDRARQFRK